MCAVFSCVKCDNIVLATEACHQTKPLPPPWIFGRQICCKRKATSNPVLCQQPAAIRSMLGSICVTPIRHQNHKYKQKKSVMDIILFPHRQIDFSDKLLHKYWIFPLYPSWKTTGELLDPLNRQCSKSVTHHVSQLCHLTPFWFFSQNKPPRAGLKSSSPPEQCRLCDRNDHNHKNLVCSSRVCRGGEQNPACVPLCADPHSAQLMPAHQALMSPQSTPTATPVWQVQHCVCSYDFHSALCLWKLHLCMEFYQNRL